MKSSDFFLIIILTDITVLLLARHFFSSLSIVFLYNLYQAEKDLLLDS